MISLRFLIVLYFKKTNLIFFLMKIYFLISEVFCFGETALTSFLYSNPFVRHLLLVILFIPLSSSWNRLLRRISRCLKINRYSKIPLSSEKIAVKGDFRNSKEVYIEFIKSFKSISIFKIKFVIIFSNFLIDNKKYFYK